MQIQHMLSVCQIIHMLLHKNMSHFQQKNLTGFNKLQIYVVLQFDLVKLSLQKRNVIY